MVHVTNLTPGSECSPAWRSMILMLTKGIMRLGYMREMSSYTAE
jgi:hypothetical protein